MAYEMHLPLNGAHNESPSPLPYDVPPIQEEDYDFKNVIQSSKNGVTYYVAELVVKCGEWSITTVTIFCHLTVSTAPVTNALFYSLHVPPKHNFYLYMGYPTDICSVSIDADGNVRYTQKYTDFDKYWGSNTEHDSTGVTTYLGGGAAAQFAYWSHK